LTVRTRPEVKRRLAGVFAHPDDDAYVIGGTLLLHPDEIELSIVFATSGEAGPISDPSLATRATLGAVREREQAAYLGEIGYRSARVEYLHHPDYYLPDVSHERLVDDIESLLRQVQPQVVVTFGPDGLTSHHDHICVGQAATEAFHRCRARNASAEGAFDRLYYAALTRTDVDRFYSEVRARNFDYGEEGALFDITGVPNKDIAVRVDTSSVRDRKWAAILQHRTQMIEHERIPESLRWIHLDSECFVQAHPKAASDVARADLLDDLV
jgi:LmbE family N-acetylglucosaminyl deacetylase